MVFAPATGIVSEICDGSDKVLLRVDGSVLALDLDTPSEARFVHRLFCQPSGVPSTTMSAQSGIAASERILEILQSLVTARLVTRTTADGPLGSRADAHAAPRAHNRGGRR